MDKCKVCKNNYKFPYDTEPTCNCMCENYNCFEPITNIDYIRSMKAEEFAEFIYDIYCDGFINGKMSAINMEYEYIDKEKLSCWLQENYKERE